MPTNENSEVITTVQPVMRDLIPSKAVSAFELFSEKAAPFERNVQYPSNPRNAPVGKFVVYPVNELNELLLEVQNKDSEDCDDTDSNWYCPAIRYLVNLDRQVLFAFEGRPSRTVPKHYWMTGELHEVAKSLGAGNVFFDESKKLITGISNGSGDFKPSKDSMQLALAILFSNEGVLNDQGISFHSTLNVIVCEEDNTSSFLIDTSDLRSTIGDYFATEYDELSTVQPRAKSQVIYEDPKRARYKNTGYRKIPFNIENFFEEKSTHRALFVDTHASFELQSSKRNIDEQDVEQQSKRKAVSPNDYSNDSTPDRWSSFFSNSVSSSSSLNQELDSLGATSSTLLSMQPSTPEKDVAAENCQALFERLNRIADSKEDDTSDNLCFSGI